MNRDTDSPGLLDALTRVGASLAGALGHRIELAGIELGEARGRLLAALVVSLGAVLMLGGAVALLTAWAALALWPMLGAAVLAWLALTYALSGIALLWWLRRRLHTEPKLLAETVAELQRDAAALRGQRPL